MSLARTALRLAAVAALEADPVVGTLCAGHIYDSLIDELDAREPVPCVVVLTEDDKGHAWSVNNGGPPFDHACDLLIEISMRVVAPVQDQAGNDTDDVAIGVAETDAEAEATIDLLEEVAMLAVTNADTPWARLIRDAVLRRATEFKSIRFASAESGSKLALRAVSLTAHLKIDEVDAFESPTGPFAALPNPLRTVAAALAPSSAAYATCIALAARLTVPAVQILGGVDTGIYPVDLTDPSSLAAWRNEGPWTIGTDPSAPDPLAVSMDVP